MRLFERRTAALFLTALLLFPVLGRAAPFTRHLDDAIALLESRARSADLSRRERRAIEKSLGLADRPHERLSQDLKTGAKICSLVARRLPSDRELFDVVDDGLDALIAEVVVNVGLVNAVIVDSDARPSKRRKHLGKIRAMHRQARSLSDPALRARRFAKLQRAIEKLLDRYGTVP